MARIAPFHGLRFNLSRADAAALLAPPYDVISDEQRWALEACDPHNVVHLDLPRGDGDARYESAARLLEAWTAGGVLRRDDPPAIYRYVQDFTFDGRPYTRRGFIALLQLEPFSARVVLPHEHTLAGPKLDRLKLMRATHAHFSQVFVLHRDPAGEVDAALAPVEAGAPDLDATIDGCRHRLWVVADVAVIARVQVLLAARQVLIADGHHRYETMLALRDELRPAGRAPGASLADWGPVCFTRAEDPGLLVLPTHRLVQDLPGEALASLPQRAQPWFTVERGDERASAEITARLAREGSGGPAFAFRHDGVTWWLKLRGDADLSTLGPPELCRLDVTVLHGLLLGPLLGVDAQAMAQQTFLSYAHDLDDALARLERGAAQAGFLMNATPVADVLAACEAGFVLPQKSTYFHPKLATGLVLSRIDPEAAPA